MSEWWNDEVPSFVVVGRVNAGKSATLATLLEVDDEGFGSWLPCRVVGSQGTAGSSTLHLEFVDLSPSQFAFVRNLVNHARAGGAHGGMPLAA